jgi:hypothetical protein
MLRLLQVFEPVRTQVSQAHILRQGLPYQVAGRLRQQDLPPMPGRQKARDAVQRWAKVIALPRFGRPGMQRHPHSWGIGLLPGLGPESLLGGQRSSERVWGGREGGAERVAHGMVAVALDGVVEEGIAAVLGSCQRLHVRTHHVLDTADPGITIEVVSGRAAVPQALTERLDRDIQADLVPVSEAVCHRLGKVVDAHRDAFDRVLLDPGMERLAGGVEDPQRRVVHARRPGPALDHQPDIPRVLGRQIMEAERRGKADHAVRHTFARLRERVMLGDLGVHRNVDAPPGSNQQTPVAQLAKVGTGDPVRVQIPRAQDTGPLS